MARARHGRGFGSRASFYARQASIACVTKMKALARPTAITINSIIELTAAALPRSIKGALPFQDMAGKNGFGTPERRRSLVRACDRLTIASLSFWCGRTAGGS